MTDWDDHGLQDLKEAIEHLRESVDRQAALREPLRVPSIAEFVLGAEFLAQPKLYPTQLTILRMALCELDHLTDYDRTQIAEFEAGFIRSETAPAGRWMYEPAPDRDYVSGTPPDVLERMAIMNARGRLGFREVNLVLGRRAGKGHVAAILTAYLVWRLLALGDPQRHFGIPATKRLQIPVFAGNLEQAQFNLFGDIVSMLVAAPCMARYLVKLTRNRLILATNADLADSDRPFEGSIEIVAKESTGTAGRGPATPMQLYDEMAFVDPATSRASAEVIYASATPALDQFGDWATLIEGSSPHQMTGEFFEIHSRGREIDHATGRAAYPEILTLQLPSWAPYRDSDIADTLPVCNDTELAKAPGLLGEDGRSITFPPVGPPITTLDEQMLQNQRARPKEFRVERLAQWAAVADPFLEPHQIDRVFEPVDGVRVEPCTKPILRNGYVMVLDPAARQDAFAWVIGHREGDDADGHPNVYVDAIRRYLPADYGGELDLDHILDHICDDFRLFRAHRVVTDQYGGDFVRQELNRRLLGRSVGVNSPIEVVHRHRSRNLDEALRFREYVTLGHVHCYDHPQLRRELEFLQETPSGVTAPTSGPVRTDDCAIAVITLVNLLLDESGSDRVHAVMNNLPLFGAGRAVSPYDQALFDKMSIRPARPFMRGTHRRRYPR